MSFKDLCKDLEEKIKQSYESGVTVSEAEKLAGEFLSAQIQVSEELKVLDLDSRMRKSGVKAVRAAIYMEAATKDAKKPSDVMLDAMVNMNPVVQKEQDELDRAEVSRDALERYYNIFQNAHIFYRGIAKGNFGG
jgi:hypothetical protein